VRCFDAYGWLKASLLRVSTIMRGDLLSWQRPWTNRSRYAARFFNGLFSLEEETATLSDKERN